MLVLRRRSIVIVSLIALLIVTGYLNYAYNQHVKDTEQTAAGASAPKSGEKSDEPALKIKDASQAADTEQTAASLENEVVNSSSNLFIEYRLERESIRSQEIDMLKEILSNKDIDKDSKSDAEATLTQLVKTNETEMAVENLIKAKGFEDAMTFIHEDSVNVVVKSKEKLTPAQVASITDVIMQQTGKGADKIKIIERN